MQGPMPGKAQVLYRTVSFLKRALHAQATVWAVAGAALLVAPGWVVENLLRQPPLGESAWVRMLGAQSIGLSMLMVMVARRLEELWWWAWAFELVSISLAVIALLNAAFGLGPGESAVLWWLLGAGWLILAAAILWGLALTAQQNPP
jgi:hypothetical protein